MALFPLWMSPIKDPRNPDAPNLTYPVEALIFQGLGMFACRLGARRQMEFLQRTPAAA